MKKFKKVSSSIVVVLIISIIAAGMVWSVSATRKVDATANDNIKIYYDGNLKAFTETDGSKISPVIIGGRTYLPLRAVADLVGLGVEWVSDTQSIKLTSNNSGIPYKDNTPVQTQPSASTAPSTTAPVSSTPAPVNSSKSAGTLEDPIKLGETFSWSATEKYINTTASADYTCTVKKVEPITYEEVTKLGFKVTSDKDKIEYAMITLDMSVSNAKITSGDAYLHLPFMRYVSGSKTPSGASIIGGTDYGFEGSLKKAAENVNKDSQGFLKKIKAGEVHNYKYEGKVILPLAKGQENYLWLTKDSSLEYSVRHAFFKLK
ncbi:stalk domain-containing protein [Pseudobacteroides cellulosolvens]|uniref:Copper amine oxidase-like domain-containing protein n=1 Tax=Pseudobacteroides cellulosolvens ATCC 35603 = DSM 2933 TaxID=398512 RepID=A0A0L6JMQ0_9FIRM|nr:stalk domain-containing protein [Pseudobacteroides cellulosolvens]KNY26657.1 copper amine oxidase-like domain-containing protein [Pseudobacteroides cellulosolvens ATCC 35603 = DSM 2933]